MKQPGEAIRVAFAPDGKKLISAWAGDWGSAVCWDVATGKMVMQDLPAGKFVMQLDYYGSTSSPALAFEPDGKWRLFVGYSIARVGNYVIAQDAATRQALFKFKIESPAVAVASSLDGKFVVFADQRGAIHLLDVTKEAAGGPVRLGQGAGEIGKAMSQWPSRGNVKTLAFFPDGTKVGVIDGGKDVRILHVATGKEDTAFSGDEAVQALAMSPDGKRAATVGKGEVRLWNAATGKEERRFTSPGAITALAFSPDGQRLATAGADGAVVWHLDRDYKPIPPDLKLTEKELAALWADLVSTEGSKVYEAARLLRADPARSVPFLRERLNSTAPRLDAGKVKQLIADLDADKFETRERATTELKKLGKPAVLALRQALARKPSAEAMRRLEGVLEAVGGDVALSPEQQSDVRAVRLLEQVGTPEARQALEALAKDAPGWWVVEEATAALERLARRAKKP